MQGKVQRFPAGPRRSREAPAIVRKVLDSPGRPLDPAARAFLEPRFGHDFSQVRIHTDAEAVESAQAVNAQAYTVGRSIVFASGQYRPMEAEGQPLIAHELAHVVQQAGLPGAGRSLEVGPSEDASEREAERASRGLFPAVGVGPGQTRADRRIQRDPFGKDKDPIHTPLIEDYRKQHGLPAGGKDEFGQPAGPSDAQIKYYGGKPGAAVANPASSTPESEDPLHATDTRTLATYSVDKQGRIQGMNIDVISKLVFEALKKSPRAYIIVRGSYPKGDTDFDPSQPGDTARSALVQWLGKAAIKDIEQRIEAQYGDSGPLTSGKGGSIAIEVWYKPEVISNPPLTPLPVPYTPGKASDKKSSSAGPDPLATQYSKPYPGQGSDVLSAFLKTPLGEKFKEEGKKQLKAAWDKTSVGEKIVILINILATLGAASYGLAQMSPNQQKAVVDLIISDSDTALQIPLKEKGTSLFEMDFDADFKPRKIRPPLGEIELK